jgi:hypothetical protein
MKIIVTMDDDGHFKCSLTSNRVKCLEILQDIDYGELWEDRSEDAYIDCDLDKGSLQECTLERFEQFLYQFEGRGKFELVEI